MGKKRNYTIEWKAVADTDYSHTAATRYEADNFTIWKGRKHVFSVIRSADEWHLIRKSDKLELHYAKTAKECKDFLEHELRRGHDINKDVLRGWCGMKFDDDFNIIY